MSDRLRSLLPWLILAAIVFSGSGKSSRPLDVLIIEDVQRRVELSPGQLAIVTSEAPASVISFLKSNAREWRIADDEASFDDDDEAIQRLANDKPKSLPWLSAARGKRKISEPLPNTTEATIKRLKGL